MDPWRTVRALLGAGLLVSWLFTASLLIPPRMFACSCMMPGPIAEVANDPTAIVVAGTVGAHAPGGLTFQVERWYFGASPAPILTMVPGDGASCGLPLQPGERLIAVAQRDEQGLVHPSICSHYGLVGTPEGQALMAEAERAFGPGPSNADPPPTTDGGGVSWVLLGGGAIALVVVVLGGLLVLGRRSEA
jgi:hypothetical protein